MPNRPQRFILCSCELFIQQFRVGHSGYLYFIWSSGTKQAQSLKYQTRPSQPVSINETLTINLKLRYKRGKVNPRDTSLFLLSDQYGQLDQINLQVSDWGTQFKELNLPIGGDTVTVRVRRKEIMQVKTIQSDDDQNDYDYEFIGGQTLTEQGIQPSEHSERMQNATKCHNGKQVVKRKKTSMAVNLMMKNRNQILGLARTGAALTDNSNPQKFQKQKQIQTKNSNQSHQIRQRRSLQKTSTHSFTVGGLESSVVSGIDGIIGGTIGQIRRKQSDLQPAEYSHSQQIMYEQTMQEFSKIKKQLEDNVYLNNKLKNDRDILMKKVQSLQYQIQSIMISANQQLQKLTQHFQKRIAIRQNIYQEQFDELIGVVNSGSQSNKKMIQQLLRQKCKLQDEVSLLTEDGRNKQLKIHQYQSQLQAMNTKICVKIEEHERLKQVQEEMSRKQQWIQTLKVQAQKEKQDIENELRQYKQELKKSELSHSDELSQCNQRIEEQSLELAQKALQLTIKNSLIQQTEQVAQQNALQVDKAKGNMYKLSEMYDAEVQKTKLMAKEIEELKTKLGEYNAKELSELNEANEKLAQMAEQLRFNQDANKLLEQQYSERQQKLNQQLQYIQEEFYGRLNQEVGRLNSKMEEMAKEASEELKQKDKLLAEYSTKLEQGLGIQKVKNNETEELKEQLARVKANLQNTNGQLERKATQLQATIKTLNQQLQKEKQKGQKLKAQLQKEVVSTNPNDNPNIRSAIISGQPNHSTTSSHKQITLGPIQPIQLLQQKLQKKQDQIKGLSSKIQDLHVLVSNLQYKIDLIVAKYPQVDLALIESDPNLNQMSSTHTKIIPEECRCDSEKQEQDQINTEILNGNTAVLESLEKSMSYREIREIKNTSEVWNSRQMGGGIMKNNSSVAFPKNSNSSGKGQQSSGGRASHNKHQGNIKDNLESSKQLYNSKDLVNNSSTFIRQHKSSSIGNSVSFGVGVFSGSSALPSQSHGNNSQKFPPAPLTPNIANTQPTKKSFLQRKESLGVSRDLSDRSQASGSSFVRVSHKQKIKQLEEVILELEQTIEELSSQKTKIQVNFQQFMKKPPLSQQTKTRIQGLKQENVELAAQISDKLSRIANLQAECLENKTELKKVSSQLNELQMQKAVMKEKVATLDIKNGESFKKLEQAEQAGKKQFGELQNLLKKNGELEIKIREGKEIQQQSRMQNRELIFINQQTTNEMKKYKGLAQDYEERLKKYAGTDTLIKQLQKQIQDWNRRNLQQIRTYNHMKLEKDSSDEQMKLLKKRHSERNRVAIEWQEKANSLERTIDDQKRKQAKYRRQVEDAQQDVRKSKLSAKKLEEQLQSMQSQHSSYVYEKKKMHEQIAQLQDQITRKQYQASRLNKELEKYKLKIAQGDDLRVGRKNQLRQEIQKLEGELIRAEKRAVEDAEQQKRLKGRLEFLEKENLKISQQRSHSWGQKLKHYVDEIASIKKLLDEYQSENTRLKLQNGELYEQSQMLKQSLTTLENKYDQGIQNEQNILEDLQRCMDDLSAANDENRVTKAQLGRIQGMYYQVKKQLDDQMIASRKKTDKLQSLQSTNQRLMQQINDLKINLSELQTQTKISHNINQKYKVLDRKKTQIEDELKKLKGEHQRAISTMVYTKEDLQKTVLSVKANERRQKEEELTAAVEEHTKTINSKAARFEAELLQMYNENSRIREKQEEKSTEIANLKLRVSELQPLAEKMKQIQKEKTQLQSQLKQSREQINRRNQKITKDQVYIQELEQNSEYKQKELSDALLRVNELQMKIQKLTSRLTESQQREQQMQEKLKQLLKKEKERAQEQINAQAPMSRSMQSSPSVHDAQMKLFQTELQLAKLKQLQQRHSQEYANKVKNLQSKIDEMHDTMKQHQKALQLHYQDELAKSEDTIMRLSQELQDKLQRIDELNQAVIIIQHQNEEYSKQLSSIRYKLDEQTQIFNIEYGKLKSKLREQEQSYSANLKSLQNELSSMGRELTAAKHRQAEGINSSRLKVSEIEQSKKSTIKRMQDKLKQKDKKVEELKSNIYILQETVLKLRKKESGSQTILNELEAKKTSYNKLQAEFAQARTEFQKQLASLEDIIRQLKQSLLSAKSREQKAIIQLEEKMMEYTSMESQLKTTKGLYSQLQKEIDKRKVDLTNQIEQESTLAMEVRIKQSKIHELEAHLEDLKKFLEQSKSQTNKKSQQLKKSQQQFKTLQQKYSSYRNSKSQNQSSETSLKKQLQKSKSRQQTLETENRNLRAQLNRLKKNVQQMKTQISLNQSEMEQANITIDSMTSRLKESESIVSRFRSMEQTIMKDLGIGLQKMIQGKYWQQIFNDKDKQINELIEQIQELKFLSDRKLLDQDQLKRQNYELSLKADEYEILTEQVESLRKICDRLQDQKKTATFKEELMKMHLSNMAETHEDQATRSKLEGILRSCNVNTSSMMTFGESSFGNY